MKAQHTTIKNISKLLSLGFLLAFFAGCSLYMDDMGGDGDEAANGDGFSSPRTVSDSLGTVTYQFAEGTVYYQEPARPYISNVRTDTAKHTVEFKLDGNTPSKWIPQKGGYITTDLMDLFDEGLNHQVDVLEKSDGNYIVKAHLVSLKDVYDYLDMEYSAYLIVDSIPDEDVTRAGGRGQYKVGLRPVTKKAGTRAGVEDDDEDLDDAAKTTLQPFLSLGLEYGAGKGETPNSLMYDMMKTSEDIVEAMQKMEDKTLINLWNTLSHTQSSKDVKDDDWSKFLDEFDKTFDKQFGTKHFSKTFSEFRFNKFSDMVKKAQSSKLANGVTKAYKTFGIDKLDVVKKVLNIIHGTGDFYVGASVNLYIKIDGHIHIKGHDGESGPDYARASIQSWLEIYSGLWELGNLGAKITIPIFSTTKSDDALLKFSRLTLARFMVGPVEASLSIGGSVTAELDGSVKGIPASGFYNKYIVKLIGVEFDSRRKFDEINSIDVPGTDIYSKDVSKGKTNTGDKATTFGVSLIPSLDVGLGVYETLIVTAGGKVTGRAAATWKSNSTYEKFAMPSDNQEAGKSYNLKYEAGYDSYSVSLVPTFKVMVDFQVTDMELGSWEGDALINWSKQIYDWPQLTTHVSTNWSKTTGETTAYYAYVRPTKWASFSNKPASAPFLLIYKKDDGYVIKDGEPVEIKAGEYLGKVEMDASSSFDYNKDDAAAYEFTLPGGVLAGDFYAVPAYYKGAGNEVMQQVGFSKPMTFSREESQDLTLTSLTVPFLTNDFTDEAALVNPGSGDVMNLPLQFDVDGMVAAGTYENVAVKFIITKPNKKTQTLGPYILNTSSGGVMGTYFYLLTGMPKVATVKDFNYSTKTPTSNTQVEVQLLGRLPGYSQASAKEKDDYETKLSSMHIGITSGNVCEPLKTESQGQNEGAWLTGFCPDVNGYGWYYYVDTVVRDHEGNLGVTRRVTGFTLYDHIESYCAGKDLIHIE